MRTSGRRPQTASTTKTANRRLSSAQYDKLALIGQMASSVAHELRNPLATITASAQSLLASSNGPNGFHRHAFKVDPAATHLVQHLREDVELILSEVRRANEIVNTLLAYAGQSPVSHQTICLDRVVKRTVALCRHDLELNGVAVAVVPTPRVDLAQDAAAWVRADENQLQQVLHNLILNARQAADRRRRTRLVRIETVQAAERTQLIVEDDGPGVPEEIRDQIFEPFYTTKRPGEGTGLGLSISADIVRAHGGTITVEPRRPAGARFVITLPSAAPPPSGEEPPPKTADSPSIMVQASAEQSCPNGKRHRLLLVDDEAGIRRSIGRFLRQSGYDVEVAASGEAAAASLRDASYDLVVSDLRMPGFSGEQLYELIKQEFPGLVDRVIFTSGDMLRTETRTFLAQTGRPALEKPYELAELLHVLESALGRGPESR